MNLDKKRDKIQKEAKDAWIKAGMIGGLAMTTGSGKSTTALHCATTVPRGGVILFLAETTSREKDIRDDIAKYKKWFKIDILKDYTFIFSTYQSAYKWKDKEFDIVIADEYHFAMTPVYSAFFRNNKYERLVGLSATLKDNVKYEVEDGEDYSKKDLINEICPVVYTYDINESHTDGTSRQKIIFVVNHRLDTMVKNVVGGTKANPFMQTEQAAYDYWDNQFKRALFLPDGEKKNHRIRITAQKRSDILYNAQSKDYIVKKLLDTFKSKTIVFGNKLDALIRMVPTISSRNTDIKNEQIRKDFEEGDLKAIGSFKKLEQGANLKGLDNVIMHSYYGKSRPIIQRLGRIRVDPKKKYGFIFIIRTLGTQEMKWFDKMIEDLTDFDIIECQNVDEAINKYREYE